MNDIADASSLRRAVYFLLVTLAVGMAAGRILAATALFDPATFRDPGDPDDKRRAWPDKRPRPVPTFGSNDRSRWATVRALVDEGHYHVGRRALDYHGELDVQNGLTLLSAVSPLAAQDGVQLVAFLAQGHQLRTSRDEGIIFEDGWTSVDKVLHPTEQKFYSSKPPLLPTLVAGEYSLLKQFGLSITERTAVVVRIILFTINLLPMIAYLWLLALLVERYGTTDWGRIFVVAAGCFGTLLTPFVNTFNNHTLATCCALFALFPVLDELTTCPDTDGPSKSEGTSRESAFLLSGLFAGFTASIELPATSFAVGLFLLLLWWYPRQTLVCFLPAASLSVIGFMLTNYLALGQLKPAYGEFGGPWYEFEGSHWSNPGLFKRGIDRANEIKPLYAFHLLLGHHGLFSLTPVFLLSIAGLYSGLRRTLRADGLGSVEVEKQQFHAELPRILYPLTAYLLLVVIGFYIVKTTNYGGVSCGPRWLMWLTPFLLLTMIPAADRLGQSRWGRALAYTLLAISVLTASYPTMNPWRHPWIYDLMEKQGWISY